MTYSLFELKKIYALIYHPDASRGGPDRSRVTARFIDSPLNSRAAVTQGVESAFDKRVARLLDVYISLNGQLGKNSSSRTRGTANPAAITFHGHEAYMCLASPGQIVEFVEGRPRPHSRSAFPIDIVRRENS